MHVSVETPLPEEIPISPVGKGYGDSLQLYNCEKISSSK